MLGRGELVSVRLGVGVSSCGGRGQGSPPTASLTRLHEPLTQKPRDDADSAGRRLETVAEHEVLQLLVYQTEAGAYIALTRRNNRDADE